jgi:ribonuclease D
MVDPQAVDLAPFADLLRSPAVLVAHACEQDLEVLLQACGQVPGRLWDTQVAAGFTGSASSSLAALSKRYLGIEVVKGNRLTDWSRRPLTDGQLAYAAADVERLLDLADAIAADLDGRDRRAWADEECEILRTRPHGPVDLDQAWWRLRDARQMRGATRGVAQEVAAWRERRARHLDIPVRHVLADLAVQAIAHNPPGNGTALHNIRGLDARRLRGEAEAELLDAVAAGRRLAPEKIRVPPTDEIARELRPAIALAAAWVAAYLRREPGARLSTGWRARMVGLPLGELVEGRAALAFDGQGRLVVEARSRQPLPGQATEETTTA